jgi:hypothetical protein
MIKYSSSSPYAETRLRSDYLDIYQKRDIPALDNDITYTIQPQYTYRPDLLSYDLYGTSKLWWVFAVRNIDTIKDPVFDFVAGTTIRLPQKTTLDIVLGA